MCVIAICNGKQLTKDKFMACFEANDDGAGFAWIANGNICYSKGHMEKEDAWLVYENICMFPHVAHFRLCSAGGVCPELTHPFLITPDSPITLEGIGTDSVLFHNGTVGGYEMVLMSIAIANKKYPDGRISDTRVMAMATSILGDVVLRNNSGKFVIVSENGFRRFGDWTEDEGIWYSNMYWKNRVKRACWNNGWSYADKDYDENWGSQYSFPAIYKDKDDDKKDKKDKKNKIPKELCGTKYGKISTK